MNTEGRVYTSHAKTISYMVKVKTTRIHDALHDFRGYRRAGGNTSPHPAKIESMALYQKKTKEMK
jgi:hypothetical protein